MDEKQQGLEELFLSVLKSGSTEVKFLEHKVSDSPIFSRKLSDCVGVVVLTSGNFSGLSHYDLLTYDIDSLPEQYRDDARQIDAKRKAPEEYVRDMVDQLRRFDASTRMGYIVVGGENSHIARVKLAFEGLNVQMIGEFNDADINYKEKDPHYSRHLVVLPATHEAILHARPKGYLHWSL